MRFHEVPKRALFSVTLDLGCGVATKGLRIGVKGYGLVTEQKKGSYRYFVDLGDRMEGAGVRTVYLDEDQQATVKKEDMLFGMSLGATAADAEEDAEDGAGGVGTRIVPGGSRVRTFPSPIPPFVSLLPEGADVRIWGNSRTSQQTTCGVSGRLGSNPVRSPPLHLRETVY